MINIRTITYNLTNEFLNEEYKTIENCLEMWKKNKYYIRTTRISTPSIQQIPDIYKYEFLNNFCDKNNIKWFSISIDSNCKDMMDFSYNMIKKFDKVFINIIGVKNNNIDFTAINNYIYLMKQVGKDNFEDNFRLGMSMNIKDDTPYFPFSKSSGKLNFTIGLELTQEINEIVNRNIDKDLNNIREIIINTVDKQVAEIEQYALDIEKKFNIKFNGFDFSLAPIIEKNGSIGQLIEKFGIKEFNGSGTLFITAFLTNILKFFGNKHKNVGFNGVMYSLLEDTKLSEINNNTEIKLEDLIKLSTMCGCGIDMVPIYDNVDIEVIKSYILDICAISCRLNKPLEVRFICFPNLYEKTNFKNNSDYILNTKILNLNSNKLINNNIQFFSLLKLKN